MNKNYLLFLKILLVLVIFTIILPYLVDSVIDMFIMGDYQNTPKNNSTFVSSNNLINKNSFIRNFYFLTKNYLF